MSEQFYKLTNSEFVEINGKLKDAELRVYLYLMTINPFCDRTIEVNTAEIAERLGLTRRTIQRAVKRLDELQLIELEITKFKVRKWQATHGSPSDTQIAIATDGSFEATHRSPTPGRTPTR